MKIGVLIVLAFVGSAAAHSSGCFPGLQCAEEHASGASLTGNVIAGLTAMQNLVIDRSKRLVWSRELYALGTTKDRFSAAYAGTESYSKAIERAEADARAQSIDGISGWRMAKAPEVEDLIARTNIPALYMYFKTHHAIQNPDDVIGVIRPDQATGPIPAMGVRHANYIDGPYGTPGRPNSGLAEINNYGIWLVQPLTPEIERHAAAAIEVKEYFEPIEEVALDPLETYQVEKNGDAVRFSAPTPASPLVNSIKGGAETRFVAMYGLKAAPRGAVVDAALKMEGVQAMGAPIPLVRLVISAPTIAPTTPEALWKCEDAAAVGVWQFPNGARLSLPNSELRNAYSTGTNLYGCFSVDYNSISFEQPKLIIRFVREDNLLTRRPRP